MCKSKRLLSSLKTMMNNNNNKRQGRQRNWAITNSVFTQKCVHFLGNLVFSLSDHTKQKKSLRVRAAGVPVAQVNQPYPLCQLSRAGLLVVRWHFTAAFLQRAVIL